MKIDKNEYFISTIFKTINDLGTIEVIKQIKGMGCVIEIEENSFEDYKEENYYKRTKKELIILSLFDEKLLEEMFFGMVVICLVEFFDIDFNIFKCSKEVEEAEKEKENGVH